VVTNSCCSERERGAIVVMLVPSSARCADSLLFLCHYFRACILTGYKNVKRQASSNRNVAYVPLNTLLAVDTEAPAIASINHCAAGSSLLCTTSAVTSCSSRCLHFSWSGVIDSDGNLASMSLLITVRNYTDVGMPFVAIANQSLLLYSSQPTGAYVYCDVALTPGAAVRAVLTATDFAGNSLSVTTAQDLVVDGTAPLPPRGRVCNGNSSKHLSEQCQCARIR
jgi:hypothetical protein